MSSSQMDTLAGWRASAHCPYYHGLSEEREDRLHRARHVAPKQPRPEPRRLRCLGCSSAESTADEKLTRWKN